MTYLAVEAPELTLCSDDNLPRHGTQVFAMYGGSGCLRATQWGAYEDTHCVAYMPYPKVSPEIKAATFQAYLNGGKRVSGLCRS